MSEEKHTPGPWRYDWDGEELGGSVIGADGNVVAQLWNELGADMDNHRSNGPLIAAAPELLDLVQAVEWVVDSRCDERCPWCGNTKLQGHAPCCKRQRVLMKALIEVEL